MTFKEEIEDRVGQEVFTKTLNRLIDRTGKSYREIASDNGIAESTFFDMRQGARTYDYMRVKRLADYFARVLNDDSVTFEYVCLGSDETRELLNNQIDRIKKDLEREKSEAAWREVELKQQLSFLEEK